MLEMKCLGTVRSIVCITATFTQQIVGQIVLGRVVFGTSLSATMLKIFCTGLQSRFSAKVRFLVRTYIYLSYHIEIKPKWPTAETSRIGTPQKFIQAEKSLPKRPKFCYLHSYHALIIWIGLLSHSSAKRRVFGANLRKIGSSLHSIKNVNKADTLRNRTQLGIRKMLCVHDTHISKNNWVINI